MDTICQVFKFYLADSKLNGGQQLKHASQISIQNLKIDLFRYRGAPAPNTYFPFFEQPFEITLLQGLGRIDRTLIMFLRNAY